MSEEKPTRGRNQDHGFDPIGRGVLGGIFGFALSLLLLLIGAIRVAIALAGGRDIPLDDLRVALFYVASFTLSGVLVGLCWPFRRSPPVRYGIGILGAGTVCLGIGIGMYGPISTWDDAVVFSIAFSSLAFGAWLGYQIRE